MSILKPKEFDVKDYTGKVAFITGAAGGIGYALAHAMGARGAKVMLADIDTAALSSACETLRALGIDAAHVLCDVSDPKAVARAAQATLDRFGKVHVVVNNAGVSLGGPAGEIAIEDWNWIVGINLMGVVHGVETFVPILKAQGEGGCIINTASMAGHLAMAGGGPYTTTKYAVVGYSETIRQELAPMGIAVSVLCPGWVRTAINDTSKARPSLQNGGAEREVTAQGQQIADAIAAGLDPAAVAEWTLAKIAENRFYIFTHPDLAPFVEGRFAEIKTDLDDSRALADMATKDGDPLDVLVIGAGFSGICAAIGLKQNGITRFAVYDKCSGIGGTWWLNTYPGAACDIPSHFYCYSFEMNPGWSRLYAPQPEIQAYIDHCAVKYGVRDQIHLGREIQNLVFDEDAALWITTFTDGTIMRSLYVINASGGLHKPLIPDIAGRPAFKGVQMHTARWDHGFDPKGKRIAIIGSAASAIQAAPELAKTARSITLFQRTPNFIAPRDDVAYSAEQQATFRADPQSMQTIRDEMFTDRDTRLFPIVVNSAIRQIAGDDIKRFIRSQIVDPDLQKKLIPDYELGCKRILISDNFLPALNSGAVEVVTDPIREIIARGIVDQTGRDHVVDAIIYATGFDLDGHKLGLQITGPGGLTLADLWKDRADAYKSAMVPGLPNYFMVTGPNAGVGTTSVVYLIEQSVNWIVEAIKYGARDKLISVKPEASAAHSDNIQTRLQGTVWATGCDSWYIGSNGRNETLFPGNAQDFADQMRSLNLDDFIVAPRPAGDAAPHWAPARPDVDAPAHPAQGLDPTIRAILSAPATQTAPSMTGMTAPEARAHYKTMVGKLEATVSIDCSVEDQRMELDGRGLDFRVYRPVGTVVDAPALVYFHGGGWVIGDLDTHDNTCRAMAMASGVCIVSVNYRRAPEHPFPAAIEDGYDAFGWIVRHAFLLGLDPLRLGIGGDSAGGNIAAAVTLDLRRRGGPHCAWQMLIYPSVTAIRDTPSARDFAKGYGLDADVMAWFAAQYIPEGTDLRDPRLSPLLAASHADLPPAFVATAGFDPLRDDGARYAQKLAGDGVPVKHTVYPDLIHGFQNWAGIVPAAGAAVRDIAQVISALAQQNDLRLTEKTKATAE